MKKALYAILSIAFVLCFTPLVAVTWASSFAARHGCRLDEAGRYPCIVNGEDWGGLIGAAFLSGWAMLITLPLAALFALALVLLIAFDLWRRHRAKRGA